MRRLFVISLLAVFLIVACTPTIEQAGKYDDFAKCLTQNGVKMYGAFWCPHCNNEKKMFGSSFKFVDYVECSLPDRSAQTQVCIDAKVTNYPTWEFKNGSRAEGELNFVDLSDKSGCSLDLIKT